MSSPAGPSKASRDAQRKSSLQRNESKKNKRHRRRLKNKAAKTANGAGVIDMTESTDDDDEGDIEIEPKFLDGLVGSKGRLQDTSRQGQKTSKAGTNQIEAQAGPSNSGSVKGKEREKIRPAPPVEEEKEEVTSAFKPMSRSILSGWKLSVSRSPSPSADSPQVEIFVDEKPDPAAISETTGEDHFQPPGLFSTSLIPRKKTQRKLREEEQKHAEEVKEETKPETSGETSLLLPEHITLESAEDRKEDALEKAETSTQDVEGLHILDDSKAKGVQRYFDPQAGTDDTSKFLASADQSRICMNCKRPGHNSRECPHILCPTCGKEDDHERRDCPYNLICFRCGLAGHKIQDCSKPRTKSGACEKCGAGDHTAIVCPTIWRMYSYYSEEERRAVQEHHAAAKGWAKEAVGGRETDRWCYNCAQEGHFGDDCPRSRGSLARFTASAFSKLSQSRGPFAASNNLLSTRTSAAPVHQRWDASDDEDDTKLPGEVTPFAGLGAGRKTIEKRKRAAMDQERQFGGSEPRHPKRGKDTGNGNGLPFGHRQFMTPGSGSGSNGSPAVRKPKGKGTPGSAAQIQFGKLSMPGEGEGTPKRGSASSTLVNRALRSSMMNSPKSPTVNLNSNGNGNTSSPLASTPGSTSKRRRKKEKLGDREEGEIEEVAFRKSGLGGGKVEGWGRELDEEEKKAKKVGKLERKRAKDEKMGSGGGGGGGGGGLSIKGRSQAQATAPGQKYHGSY